MLLLKPETHAVGGGLPMVPQRQSLLCLLIPDIGDKHLKETALDSFHGFPLFHHKSQNHREAMPAPSFHQEIRVQTSS